MKGLVSKRFTYIDKATLMNKDIDSTDALTALSAQQSILLVGFGSIGQGLYPLLRNTLGATPSQVQALCAEPKDNPTELAQLEKAQRIASEQGIALHTITLTPENYASVLARFLKPGDILVNVSVNVSSVALIQWAQAHGVLYIDTCVEPWEGGYEATHQPVESTTNAALREEALALNQGQSPQSTAIVAFGANPGLVSLLMKAGLLKMAKRKGLLTEKPVFQNKLQEREFFAGLSEKLGVKTIHIAERDTQELGRALRAGEVANTWSVDGFLSEAFQRAEVGNGTHENWEELKNRQGLAAHRTDSSEPCVWLDSPAHQLRIQSWSPSTGAQMAMVIPHHEAASIAQYLTVCQNEVVLYRPSVLYAYNPSPALWESLQDVQSPQGAREKTVFCGNAPTQFDELGVLFITEEGTFWHGSRLSVQTARQLASHNGPTTLQVTSSIAAALAWALENPLQGVVEAEDLDCEFVLDKCISYLGEVFFCTSTWSPIVQFSNSTPLGLSSFLLPTNQ